MKKVTEGWAHRTQLDQMQDEYSYASGLTFDPDSDMTRQEFREETDINTIVRKFGVQPQPFNGGDVDRTVTLHEVLNHAQALNRAYQLLPDSLRKRYNSWEALLDAAHSGELTQTDLDAADAAHSAAAGAPPPAAPPAPPAPANTPGSTIQGAA